MRSMCCTLYKIWFVGICCAPESWPSQIIYTARENIHRSRARPRPKWYLSARACDFLYAYIWNGHDLNLIIIIYEGIVDMCICLPAWMPGTDMCCVVVGMQKYTHVWYILLAAICKYHFRREISLTRKTQQMCQRE